MPIQNSAKHDPDVDQVTRKSRDHLRAQERRLQQRLRSEQDDHPQRARRQELIHIQPGQERGDGNENQQPKAPVRELPEVDRRGQPPGPNRHDEQQQQPRRLRPRQAPQEILRRLRLQQGKAVRDDQERADNEHRRLQIELKKRVNHERGARERAFLRALKRNIGTRNAESFIFRTVLRLSAFRAPRSAFNWFCAPRDPSSP